MFYLCKKNTHTHFFNEENMKKLFILMLAVMFGLTCYAQSNRVVYAISPKMNCKNCAARVQQAILSLTGVDSVKACLGSQTVEVLYNATNLKPELIVETLAGIGYTANPIEKCNKAKGKCDKEKAASATCKQRIEQATPVTENAISGKAIVKESTCNGKSCNEPNHQCSEQEVPAVKVNKHKAAKCGSESATACSKEASASCESHDVAIPAEAVKPAKKSK